MCKLQAQWPCVTALCTWNEQKQFVFAEGTVVSASNVRKDALFIEYKYAWDYVKLLNLRNEVANVAKSEGKIKIVLSSILKYPTFLYKRVGLGRKVLHRHPYTVCIL